MLSVSLFEAVWMSGAFMCGLHDIYLIAAVNAPHILPNITRVGCEMRACARVLPVCVMFVRSLCIIYVCLDLCSCVFSSVNSMTDANRKGCRNHVRSRRDYRGGLLVTLFANDMLTTTVKLNHIMNCSVCTLMLNYITLFNLCCRKIWKCLDLPADWMNL